jgi:hypothetical protein
MDIQAPYEPGSTSPVLVGGDADPGGRDIVAGTAAGAAAAAAARWGELQADTFDQGSTIGDLIMPGAGLSGATAPGEAAVHDFDSDSDPVPDGN